MYIDKQQDICYYVTMLKEIQTNELPNFVIIQDGEVITPPEPSAMEVARETVLQGLQHVVEATRLNTRMLVFDAFHGTNYRQIRHVLVEKQKRERFETSIGLVAIGKK